MNVALCAMAKCENLYINEWAEYHLNLGFDHIYVYDNNEIDGEKISDVLSDDRITVLNYRGKHQSSCETQVKAYNECYNGYGNKYDWIMFIDIDEFLTLEKFGNIKDFLSQRCFADAKAVRFHWKCYSDSGKLKYEEGSVISRFTELCENGEVNKYYKQIYRTKLPKFRMMNVHYCDFIGGIYYPDGSSAKYVMQTTDPNVKHECGCVRHYVTKSLEEFVDIKWKRRGNGSSKTRLNKEFYFKYNKKTEEKSRYFDEYFNKVSNGVQPIVNGNTQHNTITQKQLKPKIMPYQQEPPIKSQTQSLGNMDYRTPQERAVCPGARKTANPAIKHGLPQKSVQNDLSVSEYPFGVSVCISAWKTAEYIEDCLDSVAAQTWFKEHDNYEILLGIDGCEETLAKVKEIMHKYKNLKVMMMDKNVGTYVTCNTIMKEARYEWLLRFDSDDTMPNDMIAKIFANDLNDTTIIKNKHSDYTQTTSYDYVFNGISYTKEGKKYANEKCVISLTSWKKRINTTHFTIESLLSNCKNYHIVLVLSISEFPRKINDLPNSIQKYIDERKIEIIWVEKNYKAFKKVLFTMDAYRNVPVISADDDYKYTCNYADVLYNTWINHKQSFITYKTTIKHGFTETWGFATLHPPFAYRGFGLYYLDSIDMNTYTQDDSYYAVLRKKLKNDNIISLNKKIDDIAVPIETNVSLYEFRKKNKCVDSEILLYVKLLNVC